MNKSIELENNRIGMTQQLIQSESLRERVRTILRAQIMAGELVPGQMYSVAQFAETFEISPTPIREAVLDLAKSNLLSIHKNRGFVVPEVTDSELEELHKIRMLLEIPATEEAGMIMNADDIRSCEALAHGTILAAKSGSLHDYIESDRKFHSALLKPLGMRHLHDLIVEYRDRVRLRGLRAKLGTEELEKSASEHIEMVKAVKKRQRRQLNTLITRHIEMTKKRWKTEP